MSRNDDGDKIKKIIVAIILFGFFGGIFIVPLVIILLTILITYLAGGSAKVDEILDNLSKKEKDRINRKKEQSGSQNSNLNINISKEPIVNEFKKEKVVTNIQTYQNEIQTNNSFQNISNIGKAKIVTEPNVQNVTTSKITKCKYTHAEILEKLEYYEKCGTLGKKETIEKIEVLNDMMRNLALEIEKEDLVNDVKNICDTATKISGKIKKDKKAMKKVSHFIDYYFPVTLKILIKYDEIENLDLDTQNSQEFMESVEEKIKLISNAFEKQLESLYEADITDVSAELDVIEGMLKTDGYTDDDDFNLTGNK